MIRDFPAVKWRSPRFESSTVHTRLDPYWLSLIFSGIVQLVLFLRWLYRRIRNEEMNRGFVQDMATNHLPHIYDILVRLCEKQGIEIDSQPPIRWVELNNSRQR
jgi:hypothetical protein